jgi:hypothetical protein
LFIAVERVFHDTSDIKVQLHSHMHGWTEGKRVGSFRPLNEGRQFSIMEVEIDMTGKITAIVTAALLIASAGVASAQPKRAVGHAGTQVQAPYADSYYNRDYWAGVAPAGRSLALDPLTGTVFEGVAPY